MMREMTTELFDTGHQTGGRIAVAKMLLHDSGDGVPGALAEPLVRVRVADHRECAARRYDEK